ncbi:MAG: division/cell wall cluster transcriptional repressor MraZ [Actinomycetota bacterium]
MFLGTYSPRLDDKNRLILPAKYRERVSSGLVMTRGQERCLYIFAMDDFMRIAEQTRSAPMTSKAARDYLRVFLSGASDEVPDKQGRVTIPPTLRQYAGLGRDLTVIGAGTRIEVWDSAAWDSYLTATEPAFAEQAEEVIPGLL